MHYQSKAVQIVVAAGRTRQRHHDAGGWQHACASSLRSLKCNSRAHCTPCCMFPPTRAFTCCRTTDVSIICRLCRALPLQLASLAPRIMHCLEGMSPVASITAAYRLVLQLWRCCWASTQTRRRRSSSTLFPACRRSWARKKWACSRMRWRCSFPPQWSSPAGRKSWRAASPRCAGVYCSLIVALHDVKANSSWHELAPPGQQLGALV